jgi:putative oxidoreductase
MNAIRYLPFAPRLLMGLPFLVIGLSKLAAYGATIDFTMSSSLAARLRRLRYVELGCGVLMIAGYQAPVVTGVLALFSWRLRCSSTLTSQIQTRRSIASRIMTGGLLQVVPFGASAASIDNRISKAVLAPIASRSPANARIG